MVLVSGFAVHLVLAPAHPCGSLASQLCPRGLPVRPPRGGSLSTARRHAALLVSFLSLFLVAIKLSIL